MVEFWIWHRCKRNKMAAACCWRVYFSTPSKVVFLLFFALTIASTSQAYFGVSSREPISGLLSTQLSTALSNRELCDSFHLHPQQRRTCRREKGVAASLVEAIRLSAVECQRQFEFERWNCSLDFTRINLLEKEFKETSLLYALSSAGLVHAFSRACSSGTLSQCTCDQSFGDTETELAWRWGGCGDNLAFGQKFARRFLNRKKHKHKDLRALVDQHNSEVGIRMVKESYFKRCKCHGLSGTCTMKICWMQLSTFDVVGKILKHKYDVALEGNNRNNAHLNFAIASSASSSSSSSVSDNVIVDHNVVSANSAQRHRRSGNNMNRKKTRHKMAAESRKNSILVADNPVTTATPSIGNRRRLKSPRGKKGDQSLHLPAAGFGAKQSELVYLDKSPDFCGKSRYSAGTRGRVCQKGSNCQELCCGRGHNLKLKLVTSSCNCRVLWCCRVECQLCTVEEEEYTCK